MNTTPKSNRLHIAIFGRTNVGKSSFLNLLAGQDVAITSEHAGTTTDVVEKPMELLPLGPVVFLDTAGLDDSSELGEKRIAKTKKVFQRADVCVLILEAGKWTDYEIEVLGQAKERKTPLVAVVNKIDSRYPTEDFLRKSGVSTVLCNSLDKSSREKVLDEFKSAVLQVIPENIIHQPGLLDGLINPGQIAVLVVPIDLEAPKGRLILPQVQAIRDVLDSEAAAVVVKERELAFILENIKQKPAIIVCDSQAVLKVSADISPDIKFTTFSILFSRAKGDLAEMAKGAAHIASLRPEDKILIAEACTHHAIGDDIARVKIPRWLAQFLGFKPQIDIFAGKDYPEDLKKYSLIIHCGACMFNRKQMLSRIEEAKDKGVPITNYGMAISCLQGVIERTLAPFPYALLAYQKERKLF